MQSDLCTGCAKDRSFGDIEPREIREICDMARVGGAFHALEEEEEQEEQSEKYNPPHTHTSEQVAYP